MKKILLHLFKQLDFIVKLDKYLKLVKLNGKCVKKGKVNFRFCFTAVLIGMRNSSFSDDTSRHVISFSRADINSEKQENKPLEKVWSHLIF